MLHKAARPHTASCEPGIGTWNGFRTLRFSCLHIKHAVRACLPERLAVLAVTLLDLAGSEA